MPDRVTLSDYTKDVIIAILKHLAGQHKQHKSHTRCNRGSSEISDTAEQNNTYYTKDLITAVLKYLTG